MVVRMVLIIMLAFVCDCTSVPQRRPSKKTKLPEYVDPKGIDSLPVKKSGFDPELFLFGPEKIEKINIAVLDFEAPEEWKEFTILAKAILERELINYYSDYCNVIDRNNIDKALKEISFQQTGLTEQSKTGQLINADRIVSGKVHTGDKLSSLYINVIEVKTGKIILVDDIPLINNPQVLYLIDSGMKAIAGQIAK